MTAEVSESVKALVIAWAGAPDYRQALQELEKGAAQLGADDREVLINEVMEISIEVLGRLISRTDDLDDQPEEDIGGLNLHPKQIDRFASWLADQGETAKALQIAEKDWFRRLKSSTRGAPQLEKLVQESEARSFLGDKPKTARQVDPSQSTQAGLTGLLAARRFKREDEE